MAYFDTTKRQPATNYVYCRVTYGTSDSETARTISVTYMQLYHSAGWKDSFTYRYYTTGTLQPGDTQIDKSASVSDKQYSGTGWNTVVGAQAKSFKRTKTAYNLVLNGYFYTHSTYYRGSATITIPARNSHVISYNANGGVGSIPSQTKYYSTSGETAYYETLSDGSGFSRDNHRIIGWNTSADGSGTSYALSDTYTANGTTAVTLYAQWELTQASVDVKVFGDWTSALVYSKINGVWCPVIKALKKVNGSWLQ